MRGETMRVLIAAVVFSAGAVAQTLGGSWSATVSLLPTTNLVRSELTLTTTIAGWRVGATADWQGGHGLVWGTAEVTGMLGPVESQGLVLFGPLATAYIYALATTKVSLGGLEFTVYSAHVGPDIPGYVLIGGPSGGMVGVVRATLDGVSVGFEAGFGARLAPVTFVHIGGTTKTYPVDPFPGGLEFTYAKVTAKGIPFCCGITLSGELGFTKEEGFESLGLALKELPLCCGVTWDVGVTFTTAGKAVEVTPRWPGIAGCLSLYGDALVSGTSWQGIALYGLKVRCEVGDCTYLEALTAFDVGRLEELLEEDLFQGAEYEYVKLGFCGPGCCGGKYSLTVGTYFQAAGGLFGLARVEVEAAVPLLANFTVRLALRVPVGGPAGLTLGWNFTF